MSSLIQQLGIRYWFRVLLTVLFCISTVWFGIHQSYGWLGVSLCLLVLSIIWQNPPVPASHQAGAFHD